MILHLCITFFFRVILADCPAGEVMDYCKSPCQPTCQNPVPAQCYFSVCNPGCVCLNGLIRDEISGECVDPTACPLGCPKNEVENVLHSCEPSCPTKEETQSYVVEVKNCICQSGLIRNTITNECVPLKKCPDVCDENEELRNCTSRQCRRTCQNRNKKLVCSTSDCEVGCACKDPYIWDENNKKCVRENECTPRCGEHEEFRECSDRLCRRTCDNIDQEITCPRECIPGCSCKPDYVYDSIEDKCVHKDYCSTECKGNEEWSDCVNSCQETCHYPGSQFCTLECKTGCKCKKGFLWDKYKHKCVRRWDCSKICDENQVWCDYIPGDLPTCQSLHKPMVKGWYSPTFVALKPGCICKTGFIINEYTRECIDFNDCLNGNYSTVNSEPNAGSTLSTKFSGNTKLNEDDHSGSTSFSSKATKTSTKVHTTMSYSNTAHSSTTQSTIIQ